MIKRVMYECQGCGKWFKENKLLFFLDLPGLWLCPNCGRVQYLTDTRTKTTVDHTK